MNFIDYSKTFWIAKRVRIIVIAVCTIVFAITAMRFFEPSVRAKVSMFVRNTSIDTSTAGMEALFGGFTTMERDSFILSQQVFLKSNHVYKIFKDKAQKQGLNETGSELGFLKKVKDLLKQILFGASFLDLENFIDYGYVSYLKKIDFNAQLDAGTFNISYKADTPEQALAAVSCIADSLIEYQLTIEKSESAQVTEFLTHKISENRATIRKLTDDLHQFYKDNNYPFHPDILTSKLELLGEMNKNLMLAESELFQNKTQLEKLKGLEVNLRESMIATASNKASTKLKAMMQEIQNLELALMREKTHTNSSNPYITDTLNKLRQSLKSELGQSEQIIPVEDIEELMADIKKQIVTGTVTTDVAKERFRYTSKSSKEMRADLEKISEKAAQASEILVDIKLHEKLLEILTAQRLTHQIKSDVKVGKLARISDPIIAYDSISMAKLRLVFVFSMTMLLLALGGYVGYYYYHGHIIDRRQFTLQAPDMFLGYFPFFHKSPENLYSRVKTSPDISLISHRLSRGISRSNGKTYTIGVTSLHTNAGKSFSALALATKLKNMGYNAKLIDSDIYAHNRSAESQFKEFSPDSATQSRKVEEIDIISCKSALTNHEPNENMLAKILPEIFRKESMTGNQVLIVDCPPILVPDTQIMLDIFSAVVICCPELQSTLKEAYTALRIVKENTSENTPKFIMISKSNLSNKNTGKSNGYYYTTAA